MTLSAMAYSLVHAMSTRLLQALLEAGEQACKKLRILLMQRQSAYS